MCRSPNSMTQLSRSLKFSRDDIYVGHDPDARTEVRAVLVCLLDFFSEALRRVLLMEPVPTKFSLSHFLLSHFLTFSLSHFSLFHFLTFLTFLTFPHFSSLFLIFPHFSSLLLTFPLSSRCSYFSYWRGQAGRRPSKLTLCGDRARRDSPACAKREFNTAAVTPLRRSRRRETRI